MESWTVEYLHLNSDFNYFYYEGKLASEGFFDNPKNRHIPSHFVMKNQKYQCLINLGVMQPARTWCLPLYHK
jgi:hypothetical protein